MKRFSVCFIALFFLLECRGEEFGGIGVEVPAGKKIISENSPYTVLKVYKASPAFSAGVETGDRIVLVDGSSIDGLDMNYVSEKMMKGKPGTIVAITVLRGSKELSFKIPRGKILVKE